jgi:N-acylglucosamine 2-epimerase
VVEEILTRYREELTERVLPFWLRHALDDVHGGYFNCVDGSGSVYDPRKHIWMQGRGAWMFARLYNEFERRPEYLDAATRIFEFVDNHARNGEPRCWHTLTADGRPVFFQRKPYTAFFVAMAYLEYYKISGNPQHLAQAQQLFESMEQWIANPQLLGRPALSGGVGYTQLADLYVRGWLAFELHSVQAAAHYELTVRECLDRLTAHYNPELRLLMENAATGDPGEFQRLPEGRLICTGSSMEVCWLFLRMLRRWPDRAKQQMLLEAIRGAMAYGWDPEHGGLYYFQDVEGRPAAALEANMKLWWPHTEGILANAIGYRMTGDARYLQSWQQLDDYATRTFRDRAHGEWFGYCDRRGEVATAMKGGTYKGIFHVPRMLLFTLQAYA